MKEEVLGVFRGPAHVMEAGNDAFIRKWGHFMGLPAAEIVPSAFYHYMLHVMDRVYLTGKAERVEIVVATYEVHRWEDERGAGVAVRLVYEDCPPHLTALVGAAVI